MGLILALILTLAGGDHCRAAEEAARKDKTETLAMLGGGGALLAALVTAGLWRWRRSTRA